MQNGVGIGTYTQNGVVVGRYMKNMLGLVAKCRMVLALCEGDALCSLVDNGSQMFLPCELHCF